ncbi:MAG TPA: hypothetical protein VFV07_01700 [Rhizomicrobium sp.]|nr:hypothetical protein [Rhizomicrobium sp.]
MIAFGFMLFFACVASWIVSANAYLRFASVLYAALAVAAGTNFAGGVAPIVCATAPVMLAFAFARSRLAAPLLAMSVVAGLAAAATGIAVLAFAPLLAAAIAIAVAGRRSPRSIAVSLALVASAASAMAGSLPGLIAFSSVAVLGAALQAPVEKKRDAGGGLAIRRAR